jgi:hypothetical protein
MASAKMIHKDWFDYMINQYNKNHAGKYGEYNKSRHSIRESGEVVIKNREGRRIDVLEEVGMDYRTFRMKYETSDNPTWGGEKEQKKIVTQVILGQKLGDGTIRETEVAINL